MRPPVDVAAATRPCMPNATACDGAVRWPGGRGGGISLAIIERVVEFLEAARRVEVLVGDQFEAGRFGERLGPVADEQDRPG